VLRVLAVVPLFFAGGGGRVADLGVVEKRGLDDLRKRAVFDGLR
tara:strand:- start:2702 stop:2833 length:132 start_codon:yes stop_codon:yes gene_type:complete